jgi:hypothetical protein
MHPAACSTSFLPNEQLAGDRGAATAVAIPAETTNQHVRAKILDCAIPRVVLRTAFYRPTEDALGFLDTFFHDRPVELPLDDLTTLLNYDTRRVSKRSLWPQR